MLPALLPLGALPVLHMSMGLWHLMSLIVAMHLVKCVTHTTNMYLKVNCVSPPDQQVCPLHHALSLFLTSYFAVQDNIQPLGNPLLHFHCTAPGSASCSAHVHGLAASHVPHHSNMPGQLCYAHAICRGGKGRDDQCSILLGEVDNRKAL